MFKTPSGREAVGDTGYWNLQRLQDFNKVVCGRLAFDIRAECEDEFCGMLLTHTFEQWRDAELARSDMVEGCQAAAQGVVESAENTAALKGKDICGLLDHAKLAPLAGVVATNLAERPGRKKPAFLTGANLCCRARNGFDELGGAGVSMAEQP